MATDTLRDHLIALFQQARADVADFVAIRSDHDRAAQEVLAVIGFWMDYNVERIGYFARGEEPPREVDFDALAQGAIAANAERTWAQTVAYTDAAFDHLTAAVAGSSDAVLHAENHYFDWPGGPAWGEIRANGFQCPLQEMEKLYLASGDTVRAAALHAQLTAELGEEKPIACDLIEPDQLSAQRDALLVIDVRGVSEYAAGHLPGARNIPLPDLSNRLSELPREGQIVTCCNMQHPGQSRSEQAAALLSEHGYHAAALAGGYTRWTEQERTVERE